MAPSTLFRAIANPQNLSIGTIVHSKIIVSAFLPDVILSNRLMFMYAKFGLLDDARLVFDHMPSLNLISWSILIHAYSKLGSVAEAIGCFRSMVSGGFEPNDFIFVSVLSACASCRSVKATKEIHGKAYRLESAISNNFVSNSLVNSYSKCGFVSVARKVFDGMPHPNLVSWGSMISGYSQSGEYEKALEIFSRSQKQGVGINEFVLSSVLNSCAGLEDLKLAKHVHCLSLKSGLLVDSFVESGIIEMYGNSGDLESAFHAFSDIEGPRVASWAAIIKGYALEGHGEKAMYLFWEFYLTGLRLNEHLLSSILIGCSISCIAVGGMQIHSLVVKLGYHMSSFVGNAIMDFYAECGMLRESSLVFDSMKEKDVVSWNAFVSLCIQQRDLSGASKILKEMLLQCKELSAHTYLNLLSLCADLPAIGMGLSTHARVLKFAFSDNVVIGTALIDMYSKCGWLNYASRVFNIIPFKNLVSWNSMITGYAQHGFGNEALEMFERMEREGVPPNEITFIGVFSACAHVGFVGKGEILFNIMKMKGITPRIEHYACMVDLLARAGHTKRAYNFIKNMPIEPNIVIWRCLLAGCKTFGDLNIGKLAVKYILKDDRFDISARAMASSLFANANLCDETAQVRVTLEKELGKVPGQSWIEVK